MPKPFHGTFRRSRSAKQPQPLGDVLKHWLERSGVMRKTAADDVRRAWQDAVGPEIARQAQPTAFRAGVLTVTVSNAPLLAELAGFREAEIRQSLTSKLKGVYIARIRFRAGQTGRE
jgi:predicted nucleic acid-binding Zn ribbon protein